jgi:hypothetical protein
MAIAKPYRSYCWWRHFYPYERNSELTQVPGVCVHLVGGWDNGHCQTIPLILLLVATFLPYEQNTELTQVPGVRFHVVGDWDDGHCQTMPLITLEATFLPL